MATTGGTHNRGTQSSLQKGGGHTRRDSNRRESGRKSGQAMTEHQIVGFLGRKIHQAMNDESGDLSDVRKENYNMYVGAEYGNEREGYSQFVTREVLETVEWVLPSVLKVFLSGDQVVSFDPVGPEDEDAAQQETDLVNHFLMKSGATRGGGTYTVGGFTALHHWVKDCLMFPNGYLKVYMEEVKHTDVGTVTGLNAMGVQMLMDDPEVTILEQRSRMEMMPAVPMAPLPQAPGAQMVTPQNVGSRADPNAPPAAAPPPIPQGPAMQPVEVFDLKIRTTKQVMQLRTMPVPPEECLVDNDVTSLNLDDADFVCHRLRKTYTQLVNEGVDPDELDQIGVGEDYQWNDERTNRLFYEDEDPDAEDEDDPSMRTFWVHECYAWFDYDGDGVAEFRQVTLIGDRVFTNEETNYQPMVAMSAIMMPHKHTGMSYIELVKDLQLLISTLTRQLLDNTYDINTRRKIFSEDALTDDGATMEAMLNRQAEFIPVRGSPDMAFSQEAVTPVISDILPVIQFAGTMVASRTGVSPENTIDANALQEVRENVMVNVMDRASQRIEMLVRIFAETGWRQLVCKAHQLLRSHWDIQKTVKLRGKWVDVDPQGWRDRTDTTVNVGLGFHPKQVMMGLLTQRLAIQREAAGQGLSDLKRIYNTLERLSHASGLGDANEGFIDPESPEFQPPQPPPDPQAMLLEAQAEALRREADRKDRELQLKEQTEFQIKQAEFHIKQVEAQGKEADRQLKLRELVLREQEMVADGRLKRDELEGKLENLRADTLLKHAKGDEAMANAAATAVEASDQFREAVNIVSRAAETNEGGEVSLEFQDADESAETAE